MEPSPERRFRSAAELIEALSPAERAPRRAFLTFAAVAALIALIAFGLSRAGTIRAWLAGVPEKKHIAVLPFTPIGSGEEQEAFAEGLTETITAKLADLEQFQKAFWVVPSSEIRSRKPGSVEETRKAFGVTLVLTGTVQRQPHGIIVTANLVDARSLKQLLARTIEIPSRSAAALQAIVLGNLSDMMGLSVQNEASRSLMAGQTQNPEAYQLYQQGLGHLRRAEHKDVALAIGLFQEALSRDPRYSLAYARLGEGYMRRSSLTRSPADMQLAELNIRRALQLDPNSSAARAALANVQGATGRHKEALESFQVVLKSDSSNAEALTGLARLYARLGQMDQAERAFLRAIEIRPDYWSAYNNLGSFYAGQAKYDKALRMFEMVAELTPESALGFKNAGGINILLGNYPEAEKALHRANEISPSPEAYSNLSVSATFQGRHREAVQWLEKAVSMNAGNDGTWRTLGDAYRQVQELSDKAQGAYRTALEIVQKRLSLDPTRPDLLLASALYHAKLQQPAQAASALKQAYKSGPLNASLTFKAAVAQAVLGEREQALGTLEQAVRLGYSREQLAKEPELAALRKDERFIRMLATKQ
jgi:serine/threonine-protein kinase